MKKSVMTVGSDKKGASARDMRKMFGSGVSFLAKEAYKRLRINLMFALSDREGDGGCVVGMTSSLRGEGKSTTVVNLAGVLAEQGKRVIVVEGDLRLPTLRKKLKIRDNGGLSNALIERTDPSVYMKRCRVGLVDDKQIAFDVLTAGVIPPNPSELLGSKRMENLLASLRKSYDFVLLDLPPVTAVSDALAVSKFLDGVIMVVRAGVSDQQMLAEAMRQLQMVNVRVLGFIYRDTEATTKKYSRRYSNKYYKYKYHNEYAKK
jgi:capsular exopolysaccharide synthesis family protein